MAVMVDAKKRTPNLTTPRMMIGMLRIRTITPLPKGRKPKRSTAIAIPDSPPGVSPDGEKNRQTPTAYSATAAIIRSEFLRSSLAVAVLFFLFFSAFFAFFSFFFPVCSFIFAPFLFKKPFGLPKRKPWQPCDQYGDVLMKLSHLRGI